MPCPERKTCHRVARVMGFRYNLLHGILCSQGLSTRENKHWQITTEGIVQQHTSKVRWTPPPVGEASAPTLCTLRIGLNFFTTTYMSS
jgi:hypothetical protein